MDVGQSEDKASLRDLWEITKGQRVKYLLAVLAMVITNACMFSAPIIGGHAIDVITLQDFEYANQFLLWLYQYLFREVSFLAYLLLAALVGLFISAFGGLFLYARGRLAALASESIARGLREKLYEKLQDVNLSFYDDEDTGESGGFLSAGQKQLISFARAILSDPQVLVMVEATLSVDTETEQVIQQGLRRVLEGRIAFIIAHRLSPIRNATRIVMIDDGAIIEEGSHEALMSQQGHYNELYRQQSRQEASRQFK